MALGRSTPWRMLGAVGDKWQQLAGGWLAGSVVARYSGFLASLAIGFLLFASPYLSTGLNAVLVLAALGAGLLHLVLHPEERWPTDGLLLPVIAYMALGGVAVGFSSYPWLAFKGWAKMGIFFGAYLAFFGRLDRRRWLLPLLCLIAGATGIAGHGIYQWLIKVPPLATWDDAGSLNTITRVYSYLRNPNLLAGYLLPTIALTAGLTISGRGLWRLLGLASLAAQLVCLYFTYSRGGWVGGLVLIGAFGAAALLRQRALVRRYRNAVVTAVGVGALGLVYVVLRSPVLQERLASMVTVRGHSSNSYRANVWLAVNRMIQDFWATGIGPGNDVFRQIYPLYMLSGYDALGAYNIYLEVFVELGIVGLIAFVWLLGSHLARQLHGILTDEDPAIAWLLAGCLAGMLAIMAHGLVDTVFYRPQVAILFWLLLALTARLTAREPATGQ